jgi:hypothetical protein
MRLEFLRTLRGTKRRSGIILHKIALGLSSEPKALNPIEIAVNPLGPTGS